jgi:hypothetical protein
MELSKEKEGIQGGGTCRLSVYATDDDSPLDFIWEMTHQIEYFRGDPGGVTVDTE